MKKILLIIIVTIIATSCKKENAAGKSSTSCYECNQLEGQWFDVGCYTAEQWQTMHMEDSLHYHCRVK